MDGQRNQSTAQRAGDGSKTRRSDLLKDRHHKSESRSLVSRSLGESEAIPQILIEQRVEKPLAVIHQERFRVDPTPGKKRAAIRPAGVGLRPTNYDGVKSMALTHHFFGRIE